MSQASWFLNPLFGRHYYQHVLSMKPDDLVGYWPLDEASGATARDLRGRSVTITNALGNGTFETLDPGANTFLRWTDAASDGAIDDEASLVHAGSHALKLTAGAAKTTWVYQYIPVIPGTTGNLVIWTRGDGTYSGRYAIKNEADGSWIQTLVSLDVTAESYTEKEIAVTIPANCGLIRIYLACPTTAGGIAYFDDVTLFANQSLSLDGSYCPSGATYGQAGIGDGRKAVSFNGTNTHVLIGNPQFNALFDPEKGSAVGWGKVDASGRWTDASTFRYLFHVKATDDTTYYLVFGKNSTNHTLFWRRRAGGAVFEQTYTFDPAGPLTWFSMGFTWDIANTSFKGYLNANGSWSKIFDIPNAVAGVEAWDTAALPNDGLNTVLMAGNNSVQEWIGAGAHLACWKNVVLTDSEIKYVMTLP